MSANSPFGKELFGLWALGAKRLFASAIAAVLAAILLAGVALADANPIQLVLLYMPSVSNTGPQSSSGIAELVMSEGEVRITAADLPRLDDGSQYVAWVVNSQTNEFQKLGAFNTAESTGSVQYETVEPDAIPDKHWNLFLVTIEDSADVTTPGDKHSIAGVFPSPDNQPLPVLLPNTGGGDPTQTADLRSQMSDLFEFDWPLASVLGALVATVAFGAGYGLGFKRR